MDFENLLQYELLGNPPARWGLAVLVFLAVFTVLPTIRGIVRSRMRRWKPEEVHDGIELLALLISKTSRLFIFTVGLWAGERMLDLPERVGSILSLVIVLSFWAQVALWGVSAVRFWLDRKRSEGELADAARTGSFSILMFVAQLAIYSLALLLALDNLGVEIKPLLAGLGIGGLAVALAVQSVLGDLLASVTIALDKPFEVGDFLVLGEEMGNVEKIGIKSTRLRSLSGEQLVISNSDLLSTRVRNYKRMNERRVLFTIGVTYETPLERLKEIPGIVKSIVEATPQTRLDRVNFLAYGDFSLNFEIVYYVLDRDYNLYAATQEQINLALFEEFGKRGIEFAYPTQTLHMRGRLQTSPGQAPAETPAR